MLGSDEAAADQASNKLSKNGTRKKRIKCNSIHWLNADVGDQRYISSWLESGLGRQFGPRQV
ncbi:MAG: hypothetical protein ACXIUM_11370 [Wenzhouxiangella sp.]